MSNKVEIDLELYDRLRSQSDGFRLLSGKEEMLFIRIDRPASDCGIYTSQYLNILTKDEAIKTLANELEDARRRFDHVSMELRQLRDEYDKLYAETKLKPELKKRFHW